MPEIRGFNPKLDTFSCFMLHQAEAAVSIVGADLKMRTTGVGAAFLSICSDLQTVSLFYCHIIVVDLSSPL
jgi:hypothetical protein